MNRTADKEGLLKLGSHIKRLRVEKKMSQEALAYTANVSLSQISRIELGKHNTTFLTLLSICKALNVSITYFFEAFEHSHLLSKQDINKVNQDINKVNIDLKATN